MTRVPPPNLDEVIRQEAGRMARGGVGFVEEDDLYSTGWEYAVERNATLSDEFFYVPEGETEEVYSYRSLRQGLRKKMAKEISKARRAMGIEEDDRYGAREVEMLLPYIWHSEVLAKAGSQEEGARGAKIDPALGGTSMAKGVDVRRIYNKLVVDETLEQVMFLYYALGHTDAEIGARQGVSQQAANARRHKVVKAIVAELNGEKLWPQGPGTRTSMSNEQALRETR